MASSTQQPTVANEQVEHIEAVISVDGTRIAYRRSGGGPPLVLVHGGTADHTRWAPVLPALEKHYTVYAVDRRGRGQSGDTDSYAIEREFEDVAAVVGAIDGPVDLLGHSFGALCALEAALRTRRLRKLVLYEPPIPMGEELFSPVALDNLTRLLAAGERENVVSTFMREIAMVPAHELALLQSLPNWPARVAAAHTILRETQAAQSYIFDPARFRHLTTPAMLLLGGANAPSYRIATGAVQGALPNSRIVVMPGQYHTAMNTAPELFTQEVLRFLNS